MCRQAARSFAPAATSPGTARRVVREELADIMVGAAGEALIQDTTLMVSELFTNGLLLIDTLARRWTVKDHTIGKTVHVEVAIHPGSIGTLPCDASIT